jgi:hypothetical protein
MPLSTQKFPDGLEDVWIVVDDEDFHFDLIARVRHHSDILLDGPCGQKGHTVMLAK